MKRFETLWLDRGFQARLVGAILLLELFAVVLSASLTLGIAFVLFHPTVDAGGDWEAILGGFILDAGLAALILMYLGVRISARAARSLRRIMEALEHFREHGVAVPIEVEVRDPLRELVASLNAAFERIRSERTSRPTASSSE